MQGVNSGSHPEKTTQLSDTKKITRIQDLPGTKMDKHAAPVPYIKGLELPLALSKQKSCECMISSKPTLTGAVHYFYLL